MTYGVEGEGSISIGLAEHVEDEGLGGGARDGWTKNIERQRKEDDQI